MTIGPDDPTPPEGMPQIPEEPETQPALPGARVRCYACHGDRRVLSVVERNPDGTVAKALVEECRPCGGTGEVTRAKWARWHAMTQGRP